MIQHKYMKNILTLSRRLTISQCNSSTKVDLEKLEKESEGPVEVFDDEAASREAEIQEKRNKSRLNVADYALLHDRNPYPEPRMWHHGTLRYVRKLYGRYGAASGVNPALCWPTKEELDNVKEMERVKYTYNILQVAEEARQKRIQKEEEKWERQKVIVERIAKLEQWKTELADKITRKENEAKAAKVRKERLIEEVRRHFGYKVDPRDEKFKEMLEKREKEQKKLAKEARKKAKEEKMMQILLKKKPEPKNDEETKVAEDNVEDKKN